MAVIDSTLNTRAFRPRYSLIIGTNNNAAFDAAIVVVE